MMRMELEYGGCLAISDQVEVLLVNVGHSVVEGVTCLDNIANDFLDYLEKNDFDREWRNCEMSLVCTNNSYRPTTSIKFVFSRLVGGKERKDSPSMAEGTQWISDVIALMKDFLIYLRQIGVSDESYSYYSDVRLQFRVDDKQFIWK